MYSFGRIVLNPNEQQPHILWRLLALVCQTYSKVTVSVDLFFGVRLETYIQVAVVVRLSLFLLLVEEITLVKRTTPVFVVFVVNVLYHWRIIVLTYLPQCFQNPILGEFIKLLDFRLAPVSFTLYDIHHLQ